jgi:hypothetical protein
VSSDRSAPLTRRSPFGGLARRRALPLALGLANFKSVSAVELGLHPLTVIAGANSSGKSSVLQGLLLLAQSVREGTVILNGDLVKLGRPSDVIKDGSERFSVECIFNPAHRPESSCNLRVVLAAALDDAALVPVELSLWEGDELFLEAIAAPMPADVPELADGESLLCVSGPDSFGLNDKAFLVLSGLLPARLIHAASDSWLKEQFDSVLKAASQGHIGAITELSRILPSALGPQAEHRWAEHVADLLQDARRAGHAFDAGALNDAETNALFRAFSESEAPGGWFTSPLLMGERRRLRAQASGTDDSSQRDLVLAICADGASRLGGFAEALAYLGPLREDPRAVYPLGHAVAGLPVGAKGEFTAIFLAQRGNKPVSYYDESGAPRRETLMQAVSEWCSYLTIGEGVSIPSEGKLGFGFKLRIDGIDRDLTDIGVGASQLLPVVVLVLGAPQSSILLLEQPELHLHPAVQSRLADFFAQARPDLSLLIETHSEYLITRLRRRVAEDHINPGALRVLFARRQAGTTRFRVLRFNEFGDFEVWPEGFFDVLGDDTAEIARALQAKVSRPSG